MREKGLVIATMELLALDDEGHLLLVSKSILEVRERKLRSSTIREFLVK